MLLSSSDDRCGPATLKSERYNRVWTQFGLLLNPVRVRIAQAFDIDAVRQAAFNRCLNELWSKERERERQIDLPFGALFAPCQLGGVSD